MFICPNCNVRLATRRSDRGVFWACPVCEGRTATIAFLRKFVPSDIINKVWQSATNGNPGRVNKCPACSTKMALVPVTLPDIQQNVDVCTSCQFVWFDNTEYDRLPHIEQKISPEDRLPQKARELLALAEVKRISEKSLADRYDDDPAPDHLWQLIPGLLRMPVEMDESGYVGRPFVTWLLASVITAFSIICLLEIDVAAESYGMIAADCFRYGGLTFLTSFMIHASWLHLASNMYFFLVFGDNVEDFLGHWRYLLLIVLSAIGGDLLFIAFDPDCMLPAVGASGGISGILTFYALKFPNVRMGMMIWVYYAIRWIQMPAIWLFLIWLTLQIAGGIMRYDSGEGGIAYTAHLGGVIVGAIFWLFYRKA